MQILGSEKYIIYLARVKRNLICVFDNVKEHHLLKVTLFLDIEPLLDQRFGPSRFTKMHDLQVKQWQNTNANNGSTAPNPNPNPECLY